MALDQEKNSEVFVYSFDYEMNESTWVVYIAAFSQNEAQDQLYNMIGPNKIRKITSSQVHSKLDAISNELRNNICMPLFSEIDALKSEIAMLKKAKDLRTIPKK